MASSTAQWFEDPRFDRGTDTDSWYARRARESYRNWLAMMSRNENEPYATCPHLHTTYVGPGLTVECDACGRRW